MLASTNPAPAVGGWQMLGELLSAGSLPAGVNRIKLVLGRGTGIAQVDIMGGRSGPACLAHAPAARANSLAGFLPGTSPAAVLGSIGVPGVRSRLVWRYCATGGGQLAVVFPRHGGASLIAATARGYRLDGIGPGSSLATSTADTVSPGYERWEAGCSSRRAARCSLSRSGRVTAVALVGRSVLAKPGALQAAARLAAPGRPVAF